MPCRRGAHHAVGRASFVTTLVGRATHLLTWGQDVLVRIRLG